MHRLWLIIALVALGGCATVYEDRYGYYGDPGHGDYYYDHRPAARVSVGWGYGYGHGYGYDAYDSLFWGLQHSYLDPFWYPGFYYGVTYFPSYYGWSSWYAGDYWRWRNFHPYSPYYGSYWDHYYDWRPRHGYRDGGLRDGQLGGLQRFGSARNAAERMARSRGIDNRRHDAPGARGIVPSSGAAYARGQGSRDASIRAGRRDGESLRSRSYAPDVRRSPDLMRSRAGDAGLGRRGIERSIDGRGFAPIRSGHPRAGGADFTRQDRASMPGGRDPVVRGNRGPSPDAGATPRFEPRGPVAAPARDVSRQASPTARPPAQARPSFRGGESMRTMRGSSDAPRSSSGRSGGRGRSER